MESWSINWFAKGSDRAELLSAAFYEGDTRQVAVDLLGKVLVVRPHPFAAAEELTAARIVETEAYRRDDPASHSAKGLTPRSSVMFGRPGVAYVYFIYGMYEMLNFVTEPAGTPGAVLIRAAEPLLGDDLMRARRKFPSRREAVLNGPGKLCQAMGIQLSHNGESLQGPLLEVYDDGYRPESVRVSPRVGISQGRDRMWRYFISNHPFVSRAPQNEESRAYRKRGVR